MFSILISQKRVERWMCQVPILEQHGLAALLDVLGPIVAISKAHKAMLRDCDAERFSLGLALKQTVSRQHAPTLELFCVC